MSSNEKSRKSQLSSSQRDQIKEALEDGIRPNVLAKNFNVSVKTIKRIKDNPNTSRKDYDASNRFKLTPQDQINIEQAGTTSLSKINDYIGKPVHNRTIGRYFERIGFKTYRALSKTNLKNIDKNKRLSFALTYSWWNSIEWKRVIFTDETTVQNFPHKEFIRCEPKERFSVEYYNKKSSKRLSVNIWGFINFYESKIFRISANFDRTEYFELLNHFGVLEYIKYLIPGSPLYYQQDNSRIHTTPENINFIKLMKFKLLGPWPPYSPDLNPIEVVWAILKQKVSMKIDESIRTEDQLFDLCESCFNEIDQTTIQDLILRMPLILNQVISLDGEMTKN